MKKSPLQTVQERFGSKEDLVKEVRALVEKTDLFVAKFNETKGLDRVSNAKLLRLHRLATEVQEKFGSREKLVDAVLEFEGRLKDKDYRKRFERYTLGRLWDVYRSADRRKRHAAKKAERAAARSAGSSRSVD